MDRPQDDGLPTPGEGGASVPLEDGLRTPGQGGTITPPTPTPAPPAADGFSGTLGQARQNVKKWRRAISTRASASDQLGFTQFVQTGPTGLEPVRSFYDNAVIGPGPIDTSTAGIVNAFVESITTPLGHPAQTVTDSYQANKINSLTTDFLDKNGSTLIAMNQHLNTAKRLIRELSELQCTFGLTGAYNILEKKKQIGNHSWSTISKALEGDDLTPDQRKALEDAKAQLEKFFLDVRPQLDQDKQALDSLNDYFTVVCTRISIRNGSALYKAGTSDGPSLVAAPGDKVVETTHCRPDAVLHAISLHDLLLGCMGNLGGALDDESSARSR